MKRHIIGVFTGLVVVAALVTTSAVAQSAQSAPSQKGDVILTGCLVQGSSPTVFVLDKAKEDPASRTEVAQSFVVINKIEDMDLTQYLNHQVRVTGTPGPKPQSNDQRSEKELPTFAVTAIASVADTCAFAAW